MDTNTAEVLETEAQPTKKSRKPKHVPENSAEASSDTAPAEKKPRAPRKPRPPKLDADGNPLPKRARTVFLDSQTLRLTEKGINTTYRAESKRGQIFASIKDGMTVGEFYEANGGKKVASTFLIWFVAEAGVVEVE